MRASVVTTIMLLCAAVAFGGTVPLSYPSPDRTLLARVIPTGRDAGATTVDDLAYECRVEIHTGRGRKIWAEDFSSADNDHGRGVSFASWSPDSKYFVFSTFSSGGHHPWQYFTYAYSRERNDLYILDRLIGEVIDPKFRFVSPDTISLTIFDRSVKDSTADFPRKTVTVSLHKLLAREKPAPRRIRVNPPIYSPY
jgi:hypothetical protein